MHKVNLRITPGENNVPFSLLFNEHAEELSFLQICLGQFRAFRIALLSYLLRLQQVNLEDLTDEELPLSNEVSLSLFC